MTITTAQIADQRTRITLACDHLLVDTPTGLKIVKSNPRNFFNINYAVQLVSSKEGCKAEMKRLKAMEY